MVPYSSLTKPGKPGSTDVFIVVFGALANEPLTWLGTRASLTSWN
jgi:hypothetical protein